MQLAQIQAFFYKHYLIIAVITIVAIIGYYQFYLPNKEKKKGLPSDEPVDNTAKMEQEIARVISDIKKNSEWYSSIQQKATANGVTEDVELRRNAIYILRTVPDARTLGNFDYSSYN